MKRRVLIIGGVVLAFVLLGAVAWLTLTVVPALPADVGVSYPYRTTYHVVFPIGKEILIGGVPIIALQSGDAIVLSIGGTQENISIGESATITERRAVVQTLGTEVFSTNYRIDGTYLGMEGDRAAFSLALQTSRQVPAFLLSWVLPPQIEARPT
ncbi:MAG: hypothetical protein NT074_04060 [Methanomicrobiales archaeon]|nr:hypothetical protein [Methanomicrobiales archaeon]